MQKTIQQLGAACHVLIGIVVHSLSTQILRPCAGFAQDLRELFEREVISFLGLPARELLYMAAIPWVNPMLVHLIFRRSWPHRMHFSGALAGTTEVEL